MKTIGPIVLVLLALATLLAAALVNRIEPSVEVETVPHQLNPSPADGEPASFSYVLPTTTTTAPPAPKTVLKRKRAPLPTQERTEAFEAAYASEVATLIREGFARFGPDVAEEAVRVAWCESRHVPTARNGQFVGTFQLGDYHRHIAERLGFTWDEVATQARPNIAVAAELYADSGWGPWECKPR